MPSPFDLETLRSPIRTHARRLGLSKEDAEDVAQDVLIRMVSKVGELRPGGELNFAYRVMLNLMKDRRRTANRRVRIVLGCELPDDITALADIIADDRALMHYQAADESPVIGAIKALPRKYADIVLECDVKGAEYAEYAQSHNIPVGTVRSRLCRARKILRDSLSPVLN